MTSPNSVHMQGDTLRIGHNLRVTFHRTLRIPDDGQRYPLPPSLGAFPLHRIEDFRSAVPDAWRDHGGVFMPLWQREALWLGFSGTTPHVAVKVAVGKINALSGAPWTPALQVADGRGQTQDYLVAPKQPWLDGINAGNGMIRQFVAMPLGMGYTVEGQVTGEERFGGIQLLAYDPKVPFPPEPPRVDLSAAMSAPAAAPAAGAPAMGVRRRAGRSAEMGVAAGGRMEQKIYPDEHGIETWDQEHGNRVFVHIVNSQMYRDITGRQAPESPVSAQAYAQAGYPWYELYDEHETDIAASSVLAGVKSVADKDAEHGFSGQQDDTTIPDPHVIGIPKAKSKVGDHNW